MKLKAMAVFAAMGLSACEAYETVGNAPALMASGPALKQDLGALCVQQYGTQYVNNCRCMVNDVMPKLDPHERMALLRGYTHSGYQSMEADLLVSARKCGVPA